MWNEWMNAWVNGWWLNGWMSVSTYTHMILFMHFIFKHSTSVAIIHRYNSNLILIFSSHSVIDFPSLSGSQLSWLYKIEAELLVVQNYLPPTLCNTWVVFGYLLNCIFPFPNVQDNFPFSHLLFSSARKLLFVPFCWGFVLNMY